VVAFDATGPKDIVDHRETGWLAAPYEVAELARGIEWVLVEADREALGTEARERAVDRYEQERIANAYLELYESVT
jgi:glycosyltransferase involved in cell wall biosynthesis